MVAHATETCYGLACDLSNPDAVMKLFKIKQRPLDQPVSALFASIEDAKKYVEWNDEAEVLALKHLPGPLTLILLMRDDVPRHLIVSNPLPPAPSPSASGAGRGGVKENLYRSYRPSTIVNARTLRKGQTSVEVILWEVLRGNQFHGLHFRRQHPVGKYVLDFFCDDASLGIELDGSIHNQEEQKKKDVDRTLYMKEAGIQIMRFKNSEVENDLTKVLSTIEKVALKSSPSPCPQPQRRAGGGGRGEGVRTLGIRISSHLIAIKLVQGFASPISTTSANIHGQPNPYSAEDIIKQFEGQEFQPDLILDSGMLPQNPPSTVIDLANRSQHVRRIGSVKTKSP